MRAVFQAGLRPAVARLYDPFDAMLARQGAVKRGGPKTSRAPGLGQAALRRVLQRPNAMNELIELAGSRVLGGALLLMIFDGEGEAPALDAERARTVVEGQGGTYEGEGAARRWLQHRYSVSYRQAPVFAAGAFVDTMEVAAPWSKLGALYDGVRKAMGETVFVMAHFSHAYADGCCIYFSFAGSAARGAKEGWDAACEETYDRTWRAALDAAVAAGGTLAHHHGVGRSKAPRLAAELGDAVDVVRAMQRAFDPHGILNPGNLLPPPDPPPYVADCVAREVSS
jgi:alkyldihydroxyacetonephosphate synthase